MGMKTILLLEDDKNLNTLISRRLEKEGYRVLRAFTIAEAEGWTKAEEIAMVISDVMLPDGNVMEFASRFREESGAYLIYLTAMDQEMDIISGYDGGADDYITKPFSLLILISKVNAFMRRYQEPEEAVYTSGEFVIEPGNMKVTKRGENITLSKKEFQILLLLLEHAGHIVSKGQILEHVWDRDGQFVDDNTVTVNISRLKNKLETEAISNVRGIGYLWTETVKRK